MVVYGWEFLNQGVITFAGFNLINPIALVVAVLATVAITRNTKMMGIVFFPITLSLAAVRMNPGYIVIMGSAFTFLALSSSLTRMGSVLMSGVSAIGESRRGVRDEQDIYDRSVLRTKKEDSYKYQRDQRRKERLRIKEDERTAVAERGQWIDNLDTAVSLSTPDERLIGRKWLKSIPAKERVQLLKTLDRSTLFTLLGVENEKMGKRKEKSYLRGLYK